LERSQKGEFELIFPTIKNLEAISRFRTSVELLAAAAAIERVPTVLPRVVSDERGFRILLPGDAGYDEAVAASPTGPTPVSAADMNAAIRSIGADGRGGTGS
jgi:hypothetical protein